MYTMIIPRIRRWFSAVPESLRWLIVQSRYDEAGKVLRRICYVNGRTLPDNVDLHLLEKVNLNPISLLYRLYECMMNFMFKLH